MVTESQLGWVAGIIDGEGAVQIGRKRQADRWIYTGSIRVDMTDAVTIDHLSGLLTEMGVHHSRFSYERKNRKHKGAEIVQVARHEEIARFLEIIAPHLVTKSAHATLLLRYVQHRIAACHRASKGRYKPTYTGAEIEMFEEMQGLNARGRER